MANKSKAGVTTSETLRASATQSPDGGDLSGDHVIQGDTKPATSSDMMAGLNASVDDGTMSPEERKEEAERLAKEARAVAADKAGTYKIVRAPTNEIPLSVNGNRRTLKVGSTYEFESGEVEVLEGANVVLERVNRK